MSRSPGTTVSMPSSAASWRRAAGDHPSGSTRWAIDHRESPAAPCRRSGDRWPPRRIRWGGRGHRIRPAEARGGPAPGPSREQGPPPAHLDGDPPPRDAGGPRRQRSPPSPRGHRPESAVGRDLEPVAVRGRPDRTGSSSRYSGRGAARSAVIGEVLPVVVTVDPLYRVGCDTGPAGPRTGRGHSSNLCSSCGHPITNTCSMSMTFSNRCLLSSRDQGYVHANRRSHGV